MASNWDFLTGVEFAQEAIAVGQSVAVVNLELLILHTMQQHVHADEDVGGVSEICCWV